MATVTPLHDRRRAYRIKRGEQRAVDVPVTTLRTLLRGSKHGREALTEALGEKTVAALAESGAA